MLFPNARRPLLEVIIAPGASDPVRELCRAYWRFDEPGAWGCRVSELGAPGIVLRDVQAACHATLLTLVCPVCGQAQKVVSRPQVHSEDFWRTRTEPAAGTVANWSCADCRAAEQAAQDRAVAAIIGRQQERSELRAVRVRAWIAGHRTRPMGEDDPLPRAALALLAIAQTMQRTGADSAGPFRRPGPTLTGSHAGDVAVLSELYEKGWIAPAEPAPVEAFNYDENNEVSNVHVDRVPWRPAFWLDAPGEQPWEGAAECMIILLRGQDDAVREVLLDTEAAMAVAYLDGVLERTYREAPIPGHRLPDAHDTARRALEDGLTVGQLITLAWRAAAGSVAWGQRTPGLAPGKVSSAAVTNLQRHVGFAAERPVEPYAVPHWLNVPAVRDAARHCLKHPTPGEEDREDLDDEAWAQAADRFEALKQRINTGPMQAAEPDGDASGHFTDETTVVVFTLVTTDGALTVRTAARQDVRHIAGEPYGTLDRIPVGEQLTAFLPEFADATVHPPNLVATRMLELLGAGPGLVSGAVAFCRTDTAHQIQDLDADLEELLDAAHHLARRAMT
jgi:hypothetical protein